MILVERHYTKGTQEIIRLCQLSKELYNRCNYLMRQAWFGQQYLKYKQLPNISELRKATKDLDCFKQLHNTKTAMQTIINVLTDWSNFKKALKTYKENKSKFTGCLKPPNYKEKMAQVIFYNETIKRGKSKKTLKNLTPRRAVGEELLVN